MVTCSVDGVCVWDRNATEDEKHPGGGREG